MKNRIKFYRFIRVASKVLIILIITFLVVLSVALIVNSITKNKKVAHAADTDELLGTWVFNETLSITGPATNTYLVGFNSGGENYVRLRLNKSPKLMNYDSENNTFLVYSNGSWEMGDIYRTITITDTSSLTDRDGFTTWLNANAVKDVPIPPDPIEPPENGLGNWLLNETFSPPTGRYQFNFTSNTVQYYGMIVDEAGAIFYIRTQQEPITYTTAYFSDPSSDRKYWTDNSFRSIFIQTTPTSTLLDYIKNNAVYQGGAIPTENSIYGEYYFIQFPLIVDIIYENINFGRAQYVQNVNFTTKNVNGVTQNWTGFWFYFENRQIASGETQRVVNIYYFGKTNDNNIRESTLVYSFKSRDGTGGTYPTIYDQYWIDDTYKYVNFGEIIQELNSEFKNWFDLNAVEYDIYTSQNFQLGLKFGTQDGIQQGIKIGIERANGIVVENNASWRAGYEKGLQDGGNYSMLNGPKAIFGSVSQILDIPIFGIPGFTVGAIVAIVVTLGVLLFILRIIRG